MLGSLSRLWLRHRPPTDRRTAKKKRTKISNDVEWGKSIALRSSESGIIKALLWITKDHPAVAKQKPFCTITPASSSSSNYCEGRKMLSFHVRIPIDFSLLSSRRHPENFEKQFDSSDSDKELICHRWSICRMHLNVKVFRIVIASCFFSLLL